MKNKKIIYIIFSMFLASNGVFAADFYPELGMDPFYSSLNPAYIQQIIDDKEEQPSVINIFKRKKQQKAQVQEVVETDLSSDIEVNIEDNDQTVEDNVVKNEPEKKAEFVRRPTVKELEAEQKERQKAKVAQPTNPIKFPLFKKKEQKVVTEVNENPAVQMYADYMEYFQDRYEVEAIGNAKVVFTKDNSSLSANKIIFNYDLNTLKARGNVVLVSKDSVTEGDFIKIDLNTSNGIIDNPKTKTEDIKLTAKEAYIFSDRIEEYDGVAKILKNEVLALKARSFASYVDQSGILTRDDKKNQKKAEAGMYKIKTKNIYIDSKDDHEVVTIQNANLYLKNHKVAAIPSARIVSNKQNNVIETNFPEIGSQSMLGMHFGPAVVLNVPGGSTLKLAPIITHDDGKFGIGGIARFRHPHNMTELAYGTSKKEILLRGRHKIAPGLQLNYSRMTNENEWFLGYRRPKYSANLTYSRSDYVKDLKLFFSQQYSAGIFVDYIPNKRFRDSEARYRWMTQIYKPIYSYRNEEGDVKVNTAIVTQTVASAYSTGDVLGLFRVGPVLSTQVGPWAQSFMYSQSAQAGQSPFWFDRYRYGHSNIVLIESLKVNRYLSLGYIASLAINRDRRYEPDLFQENRIFIGIGPEYARVTLGYDAYRHNTMLTFSMLVGTKNSDVEFEKATIKNPDKIGKTKHKKKDKKKNYKKLVKPTK